MSIRLMASAWDLTIPNTEKMVLLCLCDFANDSGACWPSIKTIAAKCSLSDRTVQGVIKKLRDSGFCEWDDTPGRPHKFTLNPRRICTPAEFAPPQITAQTPEAPAPEPLRTTKYKRAAREISEDWKPEPFGEGTKSREIGDSWDADELKTQIEHFRAHHKANGSRFVDWQDAWSTWTLNSRRFGPRKDAKALKSIPAASDTERIKALEGKISLYERNGRESECPPLHRELASLKAKSEGIAA